MCMYPSDTLLGEKKSQHETFSKKWSAHKCKHFHFPKCESKASLHALLESGLEISTLEKFPKEVI
jgi:hypothetical protein